MKERNNFWHGTICAPTSLQGGLLLLATLCTLFALTVTPGSLWATERPQLQTDCNGGQAMACMELATDYLRGTSGAVDEVKARKLFDKNHVKPLQGATNKARPGKDNTVAENGHAR